MKKLATAAAVALLGATLSFAAAPPQQTMKPGPGMQTFAQKLNLTEAQQTKIQAIQKETRDQNGPFLAQSRKDWESFLAARQANDTAAMAKLKPTLDADMARIKTIREAEEAKVIAILTADQKATWQQMKAERAAAQKQRAQQPAAH